MKYGEIIKWIFIALVIALTLYLVTQVEAHERHVVGAPLQQWFNSLQSGRGPCCSDADGTALSEVEWESVGGHYRVNLWGRWHDVPDEAVLKGPNLAGYTMVWPIKTHYGIVIRCFIPGAMI